MLKRVGIETRLQLVITVCVLALVIVTTLGRSGGAPEVFLTYRTLLPVIAILSAIGSRGSGTRICPWFIGVILVAFTLMLLSVLRIPGSRFGGFYLWYKHALFIAAFLSFAHYARYQPARWKGLLLGSVIVLTLVYLLPDLILGRRPVAGFSSANPNYFATFLLLGFAPSLAVLVFAPKTAWRIAAGAAAALTFAGILLTWSRGATLAALAAAVITAIRAGSRVPRRAWMFTALLGLVTVLLASPYLVSKFLDRGEADPYNYARIQIWRSALGVIAERPVLGVGFGQFLNVSKRFTLPVEGKVARYLKRAQIAHSEYLQHIAEVGIPAAGLLFATLAFPLYTALKRAKTAWPEYRCFQEAAVITAAAVGTHAIFDNCWTIPVSASAIIVLSLADLLPLRRKAFTTDWTALRLGAAATAGIAVYVHSTAVPALGLYYNERGHQAYERFDSETAERFHLAAIAVVPDHALFLDNLGMVYLDRFAETKDMKWLDSARVYFAKAIAQAPRALESYIHMEAVLVRLLGPDPQKNAVVFRELIETQSGILRVDPYLPFTRGNLAGALYTLGQRDRAFQEMQKALEYEPNYVPGHLMLASWYAEQGNALESRRYTQTAMAIVEKYKDFKPQEAYEGVLLGRPEASFKDLKGRHQ